MTYNTVDNHDRLAKRKRSDGGRNGGRNGVLEPRKLGHSQMDKPKRTLKNFFDYFWLIKDASIANNILYKDVKYYSLSGIFAITDDK